VTANYDGEATGEVVIHRTPSLSAKVLDFYSIQLPKQIFFRLDLGWTLGLGFPSTLYSEFGTKPG